MANNNGHTGNNKGIIMARMAMLRAMHGNNNGHTGNNKGTLMAINGNAKGP